MGLDGKKFCLFIFFGAFATHLVYLGELTQIKYMAVKNKSVHYSQFVDDFLHEKHTKNNRELLKNHSKIMTAYFNKDKGHPYKQLVRRSNNFILEEHPEITKVLLISSNPRSGSSFTGKAFSTSHFGFYG